MLSWPYKYVDLELEPIHSQSYEEMQGENQMKFLGLLLIADEMINRIGKAPCNQKLALGRKGSHQ